MQVVDVRVHEGTRSPFVEMRPVAASTLMLPIFIGMPEAAAIKRSLEGRLLPRPLTHELLASLIPTFGARLDQVVVTEFADQIFHAELHFSLGERREVVPCRPSDGIALAMRLGAKVFVNDEVLDECGVDEDAEVTDIVESVDPAESDKLVEEFSAFLDNLRPEDFGGEK
jgi:uncharacterized protein